MGCFGGQGLLIRATASFIWKEIHFFPRRHCARNACTVLWLVGLLLSRPLVASVFAALLPGCFPKFLFPPHVSLSGLSPPAPCPAPSTVPHATRNSAAALFAPSLPFLFCSHSLCFSGVFLGASLLGLLLPSLVSYFHSSLALARRAVCDLGLSCLRARACLPLSVPFPSSVPALPSFTLPSTTTALPPSLTCHFLQSTPSHFLVIYPHARRPFGARRNKGSQGLNVGRKNTHICTDRETSNACSAARRILSLSSILYCRPRADRLSAGARGLTGDSGRLWLSISLASALYIHSFLSFCHPPRRFVSTCFFALLRPSPPFSRRVALCFFLVTPAPHPYPAPPRLLTLFPPRIRVVPRPRLRPYVAHYV